MISNEINSPVVIYFVVQSKYFRGMKNNDS
jgi:hypothetical protein